MRRLATVLLLLPLTVVADERILSFHSDIRVFADGMIEVTETITVRAEGDRIRRGIYRDFPVEYEDRLGNRYEIRLEPLAVMRDDRPEAFHTQRMQRDVRTYFGSADRLIAPGVHTYRFRYRANRMLGFFDEHDELYWNVTGFDWAFPIDEASATVRLEFDAPRDRLMVDGYTGPMGSRAQDYSRRLDEDGNVQFKANSPLSAVNGLTIVVGWPKGFVTAPSAWRKAGWLLADNANLLVAVIGFALMLLYYVPTWRRYGKDPEPGVIVTRYEPPTGFSPASLRYIRQMYYDDKVMTAAIVNLAVKGYLTIERAGDTHWLRKAAAAGARETLAAGERELFDALFRDGDVIELDQENHELLGEAREAHSKSLTADYKPHYFRTNLALNLPAILIAIVTILLAANVGRGVTPFVLAAFAVTIVTLVVFAINMRRPTLRGRQLLDEMLGFKDYLEIAEKDEMNLRNPPDKTPELFERLLPFALALGVEQQWAERFAAVLAAIREPGGGWQPGWYRGDWNSASLRRTTRSLSSGLHTAVRSSVSPPGSSSGGGGGGFSGGGGGGGGGGGW